MKTYLNTDAVYQFDEADLLARMEWINSLNRKHRWKDWILQRSRATIGLNLRFSWM